MLDVYIGFMDEEVRPVLDGLLDEASRTGRRIYVVERGAIGTSATPLAPDLPLFQRPLSGYAGIDTLAAPSPSHVVRVEYPQGAAPKHDDPLASALQDELGTFIWPKIAPRLLDGKQKERLDWGDVLLSVLRFDRAPLDGGKADAMQAQTTLLPVILVRSPEMGVQASLVRPFLRAILKGASRYAARAHPNTPIRLTSYASGGAILPTIEPGTLHEVGASVFIGTEADNGRIYGKIAVAAVWRPGHSQSAPFECMHLELVRRESSYTSALDDVQVERDEISAIRAENRSRFDAKEETDKAMEKALFDHAPTLEPILRTMGAQLKPTEMTATWSFFDDLKTKERVAKAYGPLLVNSNMEDYHLLRVARSMLERGTADASSGYSRVGDVRIDRVVANGAVSPEVEHAIVTWVGAIAAGNTAVSYTPQDYEAAITWGLRGCRPDDLQSRGSAKLARWSLLDWPDIDEPIRKQLEASIYRAAVPGFDRQVVLDPFLAEIATDFVADVAAGAKNDPRMSRGLPGKGAVEQLKATAAFIDAAWRSGQLNEAEQHVSKLGKQLADHFGNAGGITAWLRPGKWVSDGTVYKLDTESAKQFAGKAIDRLLYKSAILLVLAKEFGRSRGTLVKKAQ